MNSKKNAAFFNRELSWIEFNARILEEACNKKIPLLERLQFLGIVSSNFDEFFQVRVASVKRLLQENPDKEDISGLTPRTLLFQISARCHEIIRKQHFCLINDILPELSKNGIEYVPPEKFTSEQRSFTNSLFNTNIFPLLTPLRIDTENFPNIQNLKQHAAFMLSPIEGIQPLQNMPKIDNKNHPIAIVQIPSGIDRVIWFNDSNTDKHYFCLLEDLIIQYGTQLFPGFTVTETMLFKITRDADFAVDEFRDNDFIDAMEEVLVKRQTSFAVRILCNQSSPTILKELTKKTNLTESDVYKVDGIIDPSILSGLQKIEGFEHLRYPVWHHFYPTSLPAEGTYWDTLKQNDVMLNLPYESYEPVIKLLCDAAIDPKVLAIKMTLYRTGKDSPIIKALINAANNGKQVTCFVELKARFDEELNISWAEQLEKANVTVVYGVVNYKVHAKFLMIMRRENAIVRRYVYLATGNFNPKTAQLYSDLGIFTSNNEIANDATQFFNIISGYSAIQTMNHISMAPINLKSNILAMIQREIDCSTPEHPGLIMAKMNSLSHEEMINALYKASQAGVKVLLNIRGICMLVPGVPGLSENITVISIVDHYLEHSRIFYFNNAGSDEIYLSSADWMVRNLDRRIELMFPITDRKIFKEILDILNIYFKDNTHSHTLLSNGKWIPTQTGEESHRAQEELYLKYKEMHDNNVRQPKTEFQVRRNDK